VKTYKEIKKYIYQMENRKQSKSLKKKKNPSWKRAGGVAQGVGPEFKLQYHKKKKKAIDLIATTLYV
jgi:hypothetical protein